MTHRRERRKARLRSDNLIFVDEVFLENAVTCSIRVLISRLWVQSHQAAVHSKYIGTSRCLKVNYKIL